MTDIRRKSKVPLGPGGPLVDAELIEVTRADEKWSTYDLDDGTVVKFRAIVTEVWRLEGQFDAEGNPIYILRSQNVTTVTAPQELKKKR